MTTKAKAPPKPKPKPKAKKKSGVGTIEVSSAAVPIPASHTEQETRPATEPPAPHPAAPEPDAVPLKPAKQRKAKAPKPEAPAGPMSGLDAAAKVLAEAGVPMNVKDLTDSILAQKLWFTDGKTPGATIYAAIISEIAAKGPDSRFRKTDRGLFEAARKGE